MDTGMFGYMSILRYSVVGQDEYYLNTSVSYFSEK